MPELPEVEHAARCLRAWLTGIAVTRVEAPESRIFRGTSRRSFQRSLTGRRLERVERRGKVLLLHFDGGIGVLSHLGMTGKWVRRAGSEPPPAHRRASLHLEGGAVVHYCDPRMFGRLALHSAAELASLPEVAALGPDPLADGLDAAALHAALGRTARAVKVALLDQRLIAGVGNIYATEALFRARIHPAREARRVTRREAQALAEGIRSSFEESLARMGEEAEYLSDGAHVDNPFQIYDRAGAPCPRCRRPIVKETIGGRTSAFCARCQK